jgi:predicted Zn finger-like uncharacterized protein
MLITTCAHCHARFRVTPEQLNARQGQVRCGQCEQVFNGFESLERQPTDDTGTRLLAAHAAASADSLERLEPIAMDSLREALDDLPSARLEQDEASVPAAKIEDDPPAGPSPPPATTHVPLYTYSEPIAARAPLSRAWSFGVALLAVLLAVQALYAFRAQVAQRYPDTRPWLESACASIGCTVPWVNEESALKLEDSELLEVPGKANQIALSARIRNMSRSAQEFPHLELTLTDLTGQTAVRRVLRPMDYLGRVPVTGEVMAPGSEALVSLRLETARVKPTGYELLLFYP